MVNNNTNDTKSQLKRCPNSPGAYSVLKLDGKSIIAGPLCCNQFSCEYCAPRLKKKIFARALRGPISNTKYNSPYALKHLTMTYGGHEARALVTPEQAYEQMADAWHKLRRHLTRVYGDFHYFRVTELHKKGGWPHFHILIAGDAIAPKDVLNEIESYWRDRCGLGFVHLNCKDFKNIKHAINYMLKYLTKDIKKVAKYKRVFSASRSALMKIEKVKHLASSLFLGSLRSGASPVVLNVPEPEFHKGCDVPLARWGDTYRTYEDVLNKLLKMGLDMCRA